MKQSEQSTCLSSPLADRWVLDPAVVMLNHGSFGACPGEVLQRQQELRAQMESEPVRFFTREAQPLLDESRAVLAEWLGVDADDLVFVRNATYGVNSVLRSLKLGPQDELLVTNHSYNACRNVVDYVARRAGARVVTVEIGVPVASADEITEAILAAVTSHTRLALIDHITSPTALVFPIEQIVRRLAERGVEALIDGSHAPGMVPLDVGRIGAAYYVGNCHKWVCAPKGAGFLHVRRDRQDDMQPAVISHGFNIARPGYSRLHDGFDWAGTDDLTAWLCVGRAIRFVETLLDGGLSALMRHNHELAVRARRLLAEALDMAPLCPEEMLGSMAALRLPDESLESVCPDTSTVPLPTDPLQAALFRDFGIEVPIFYWPAAPQRLLRISAQAYNSFAQYEFLGRALQQLLSGH